jgi:hypothetical protein
MSFFLRGICGEWEELKELLELLEVKVSDVFC